MFRFSSKKEQWNLKRILGTSVSEKMSRKLVFTFFSEEVGRCHESKNGSIYLKYRLLYEVFG